VKDGCEPLSGADSQVCITLGASGEDLVREHRVKQLEKLFNGSTGGKSLHESFEILRAFRLLHRQFSRKLITHVGIDLSLKS
jgi:hypothetical protein